MTRTHLRKIAAGLAVGTMVLGASATAASAKSHTGPIDTDQNKVSYWEAVTGQECMKDERVGNSYTVPAGDWSLLVIKAGSARSVENVNDVISNPVAGTSYSHSSGKGISHVILCSGGDYGGGGGGDPQS
jgi:hypothetical protein